MDFRTGDSLRMVRNRRGRRIRRLGGCPDLFVASRNRQPRSQSASPVTPERVQEAPGAMDRHAGNHAGNGPFGPDRTGVWQRGAPAIEASQKKAIRDW